MKLLIVAALFISFNVTASNNRPVSKNAEEAKAITACIRAMNVLEKRDETNARAKNSSTCDFNGKTARYWHCVEKRLVKGQSLEFSTARCKESESSK